MKYNLNFMTLFLVTTLFSNAMEKQEKKNTVLEITVVGKPSSATYLNSHRALISGNSYCGIIDPLYNKEIKQLFNKGWFYSASVHPDKKKIALIHENTLTIYNTQTNVFGWKTKCPDEKMLMDKAIFSPLDETIFIKYNKCGIYTIKKYNYSNSADQELAAYQDESIRSFALHPTQKNIFFTKFNGDLCIHSSDNFEQITKTTEKYRFHFCKYSPDGSLIVVGNHFSIVIKKSSDLKKTVFSITTNKKYNAFEGIKFCPKNYFLAILYHKKKSYAIQYWDIKKHKHIHTTSLKGDGLVHHFDCSNIMLLLTLDSKCVARPLDIELFKEEVFMYWILKNYQKHTLSVPNEIITCIMNTVTEI